MTDAKQETFAEYVDRWDALVAEINKQKKETKRLTTLEMEMRKGIAASIASTKPDKVLEEGINKHVMPDGRTLKITRKIKREIDEAQIVHTRTLYGELNSTTVTFDELLRTKYELSVTAFRKLEPEHAVIISRMITSKDESPEVVLD